MKNYTREYPCFSLCGLNCGLCPKYNSSGVSACPGCGGNNFHLKHPTCSVITCNLNHDKVEFCYECKQFPCIKYQELSKKDSFITYLNVKRDFDKCLDKGLKEYKSELNKKIKILETLLDKYNNGRLKQFYCIALNLLELSDLQIIMKSVTNELENNDLNINEKIQIIVSMLNAKAAEKNIELKLRK